MKRAAHAVADDHAGGRALGEEGWADGSGRTRRLGPIQRAGHGAAQWAGFANLARTVTEKLIREGGARDEDTAAARPEADILADVQHVLGGECDALDTGPMK